MKSSIRNWLGRFSTTYRFDDGSIVHWTSRESLAIEHENQAFNVVFCYNGACYEYLLPEGLPADTREALERMLDEYCLVKGYPLANSE